MANIKKYETASGQRWRVRYRRPNGRQTDKRGFRTKKAAELWAADNVVAMATGAWVNPADGKVTLGALGEAWIARQTHLKPSSWKPIDVAWRTRVKSRWADVPLEAVRHTDIQAWLSTLTKTTVREGEKVEVPLAPTGVIYAHQVLRSILADAVRDRRLASNPADGVTLPRKRRSQRPYLSHEQLHALADAAAERRTLVLLLGYLGLRWGEVAGLQVRDVNLLRRRISIERNIVQVGSRYHLGTPKSGEVRSVPVPAFLAPLLEAELEGKTPTSYLFQSPDGGHLRRPPTTRGWFQAAITASGVPRVTPHDLRHTAASLAVSAGANVKALQKMLGHASATMTLDVYADLFDEDLDSIATTLDAIVGKMWAEGS